MARVHELIEAGQPPRENERALVVLDEAAEAELELSFYDYQQSRFIAPQGLTSEPHFFRATLGRTGEKQGYLVGPEVTRFLRYRALFGIASRTDAFGDVPSDVRAYRLFEHGATIDIPLPKPPAVAETPRPAEADGRGAGGDADRGASGGAAAGAGVVGSGEVGRPTPEPKPMPERKAQQQRRLAFATGSLAILLMIAAPFALARLAWYGFVVGVKGSLDFTENPRQSAADPIAFTPEYARVEIRRAFWARPFEGWWISEKPPAQIEFGSGGWLTQEDQSRDREVIIVLRPKAPAPPATAGILRSRLTFRNTATGQAFDSREATLRPAESPVAKLSFGGSDPIVFTGYKGGSFNPESAQIRLSASGTDARWSTRDIPSWISLSGDQEGKLDKDSSVTLTVTPQTANLAPGPYDGQLTFRDDQAKTVAQKPVHLVVLDPAVECDRRTGSRFDPDRPATAPFMADSSTLSDDELEVATRACAAAFQSEPSAASRRFIAEMGRAFAARAVRSAKSGADTDARTAMSNAVRLWQEAATKGSSAAMNSLGYYWAGLYDDEVDPPAANKCRSAPIRFSFTAKDMKMARDYWERAARASPPNAEAMSRYGTLLVTAPDLCPPRPDLQNAAEGISWLKQAVDRGNVGAAAILGELFYRGRVPSPAAPNDGIAKNLDEGSRWLAIACKGGDARAKDVVGRMISTTKEMDSAKRPPGC
jgi:TPR repeat protein